MKTAIQVVVFRVENLQLALPLSSVERVFHAVAVTPLPQAPATLLGVINVQGRVIPVVNLRKLLGLPEREVEVSDHLIITRIGGRAAALLTDEVRGVMEFSEQDLAAAERVLPHTTSTKGMLKTADGVIPVCNIERFLSLEDEQGLAKALPTAATGQ